MEPNCAALAAMAKRAQKSASAELVELLKTSDFAHGQWEFFKKAGRSKRQGAQKGRALKKAGRSKRQGAQASGQTIDTSLAVVYKPNSLSLTRS